MNNPIRILLVDDSPYFVEAAQIFLGYYKRLELVDTAREGEDALAKAQALKPDVILLDLNLGDRSGLDLIPLFRDRLSQTRIIILTVMYEDAYRAASLSAGADAFVSKSAMGEMLIPVIERLMEFPAAGGGADPKALLDRESTI